MRLYWAVQAGFEFVIPLSQAPEYLELQAFTTRAGSVIDTAILSNDITSNNKVD